MPFRLQPTRNCTSCCAGVLTVDLDASADGRRWANATGGRLEASSYSFDVALLALGDAAIQAPRILSRSFLSTQNRTRGITLRDRRPHGQALPSAPTVVRHTAASAFPQCALYGAEGLPMLPFRMDVTAA